MLYTNYSFSPNLIFFFLTFNHKQIIDWKPTFFLFFFFFSLDSCNNSLSCSVTGVIQGMAFTVGGVENQIFEINDGKKKEKKKEEAKNNILVFIIVATYRQ